MAQSDAASCGAAMRLTPFHMLASPPTKVPHDLVSIRVRAAGTTRFAGYRRKHGSQTQPEDPRST